MADTRTALRSTLLPKSPFYVYAFPANRPLPRRLGNMATKFSDAAVEAANLALKMGSAAVDMVSFIEGFGGELPVVGSVLKTLKAMRETVETVQIDAS